eukprot:TRINITY_DN2640_c0_g2_i1.p1 TRINITY_DN2640_c0_g2~~TRINITY_DN2640_c0_g2_i1.p1  ORF type:complete len:386 (-),score=83.89 TRINITY_DN2640_c0_g2_i1:348-1505(-)
MCLYLFLLNVHPDVPFAIIGNRDEFKNRKSDIPDINSDNIICGLDKRSNGTWIGVNIKTGSFCAITNIGGRGGIIDENRKKMKDEYFARGNLVYKFLKDPYDPNLLKNRKYYQGYNLIWGNIFKENVKMNYNNNCDPSDKHPTLPIITSFRYGYFGLGNDFIDDEYVKCKYIEKRGKEIIKDIFYEKNGNINNSNNNDDDDQDSDEKIVRLRDELDCLFDEKLKFDFKNYFDSDSYYNIFSLIGKFIYTSPTRRIQPGLRTSIYSTCFLTILMFLLIFINIIFFSSDTFISCLMDVILKPLYYLLISFFISLLIGLIIGFVHHLYLQDIFVDIDLPFKKYGTISKTCIIVTKDQKLHYYFKETKDKDKSKWTKEINIDFSSTLTE